MKTELTIILIELNYNTEDINYFLDEHFQNLNTLEQNKIDFTNWIQNN